MTQIDYFKNGGLSIPVFIATCYNIADFSERDLPLLLPYGITLEKIQKLRSMADDLTDTKSNKILQAQKKVKTKNKDNYQEYFVDKLSIVKTQLSGLFNHNNATYDTVFTKPHADLKTKDFLTHLKDIFYILTENKEALVEYHFTETELTAFQSDIDSLTRLEKEREQAEISFNNDTFARSEARRITYELLYYIASMGRVYWKRKNPAMSQDYIISRNSKKKKTIATVQSNTESVDMEIVNTQSTQTSNYDYTATETPTNTGEANTGNPVN